MNKPYIVCHMMTSIDGRIDCNMTEQLSGVEEYYFTLNSFNAPTTITGKITALLEISLPGKFINKDNTTLNKEMYYKYKDKEGYEIIVDSKGSLLYEDQKDEEHPLLILTSEKVSLEYLNYLKEKHISWIACGKDKIDLKRACEILFNNFNVKRMALVGGGHINAGFLKEGLIDEISILIGPGIDGRDNMCAVFDGLPLDSKVTPLKLESIQSFKSGAIWIKYKTY